jgi:hypothetical protein
MKLKNNKIVFVMNTILFIDKGNDTTKVGGIKNRKPGFKVRKEEEEVIQGWGRGCLQKTE